MESAIAKMHGIGFAVGDLSLSNVLINDSLEIKLIDFEAAKKLSQDFQVDIATPGFTTMLYATMNNKIGMPSRL